MTPAAILEPLRDGLDHLPKMVSDAWNGLIGVLSRSAPGSDPAIYEVLAIGLIALGFLLISRRVAGVVLGVAVVFGGLILAAVVLGGWV